MPNVQRLELTGETDGNDSQPLDLAIVVLNYNTADLLRQCLRSVFASEGNLRFQVCVVDNASSDQSVDVVAGEFPDVHLIANKLNVGYSAGNNLGLRFFGFDGNQGLASPARKGVTLRAFPPEATLAAVRAASRRLVMSKSSA